METSIARHESRLGPAVEEWKLRPRWRRPGHIFCWARKSGARQGAGPRIPEKRIVLLRRKTGSGETAPKASSESRVPRDGGAWSLVPRTKCIDLCAGGSEGPDERIAPGIVVSRLGYIRSPGRLASLYRAADVYVHAALEETSGLSVAEALACGAPVVTASRGGVLELVRHGRSALTVPSRLQSILSTRSQSAGFSVVA